MNKLVVLLTWFVVVGAVVFSGFYAASWYSQEEKPEEPVTFHQDDGPPQPIQGEDLSETPKPTPSVSAELYCPSIGNIPNGRVYICPLLNQSITDLDVWMDRDKGKLTIKFSLGEITWDVWTDGGSDETPCYIYGPPRMMRILLVDQNRKILFETHSLWFLPEKILEKAKKHKASLSNYDYSDIHPLPSKGNELTVEVNQMVAQFTKTVLFGFETGAGQRDGSARAYLPLRHKVVSGVDNIIKKVQSSTTIKECQWD